MAARVGGLAASVNHIIFVDCAGTTRAQCAKGAWDVDQGDEEDCRPDDGGAHDRGRLEGGRRAQQGDGRQDAARPKPEKTIGARRGRAAEEAGPRDEGRQGEPKGEGGPFEGRADRGRRRARHLRMAYRQERMLGLETCAECRANTDRPIPALRGRGL
jgi:hypothetical protein